MGGEGPCETSGRGRVLQVVFSAKSVSLKVVWSDEKAWISIGFLANPLTLSAPQIIVLSLLVYGVGTSRFF